MFTREELQKIIDRNQSSGLVISRTEYAKLARQCLAYYDVVYAAQVMDYIALKDALDRLDKGNAPPTELEAENERMRS